MTISSTTPRSAADAGMAPDLRPNLSLNALRKIATADSWDTDSQFQAAKSRRLAWWIAGAGVTFGLLGFANSVFQSVRPLPAPPVILVDRFSGDYAVSSSFDESSVPQLDALDQHNASVFVRARESYYFNLLQRDYDQVARMSTPQTWAPYAARFSGDNAMQVKIGPKEEHRVTIVSVRLSTTTKPGRRGEAIVTYDEELHNNQGPSAPITRFVATVEYEYRPRSMKTQVDRNENPFGFVVLTYRTDAELTSPVPPVTEAPHRANPT